MLLATFFLIVLGQDLLPQGAVETSPTPATQLAEAAEPTAAPLSPEQARLAAQRRHSGGAVCEHRAPTGSVLNRRVCRTERRARTDAAQARSYVAEVARGSVNEPYAVRP